MALDLIFINDGSTDNTLERLLELKAHHTEIRVDDLSRNFGKEAALTAGLNLADPSESLAPQNSMAGGFGTLPWKV